MTFEPEKWKWWQIITLLLAVALICAMCEDLYKIIFIGGTCDTEYALAHGYRRP